MKPACPALSACTVFQGTAQVSATSVVGRWYRFQSTSNFVSWANVLLFTNSNDSTNFYCTTPLVDPSAADNRFYRLSAQ